METKRLNGLWVRFKPVIIPSLFLIITVGVAFLHDTFEEWDGVMQLLAGREIFQGLGYHGWTSHFWPPLYSCLIGFIDLFIDGFWAAKLISIISGSMLLFIVFKLAVFLTSDIRVGLISQLFLVLNPFYFLSSIQAENHMLDSLFFITGLLFLLKAIEHRSARTFAMAGGISALACLSRYTSYVLPVIVLITVFVSLKSRDALKMTAVFFLFFLFVSAPWYYVNTMNNGSPLHTWQYMNTGAGFVEANTLKWWWSTQSNYNSLLDVVSSHLISFLKHWLITSVTSVIHIIRAGGVLGVFFAPALLDAFLKIRPQFFLPLIGSLILLVVGISQAFTEIAYLLSVPIIITPITIFFVTRYLSQCEAKYDILNRLKFGTVILAVLLIGGLSVTSYYAYSYISNDNYDSGLVQMREIAQTLKAYDSDLQNKYVMAVHPASSYYLDSKFLAAPTYYEGDITGLVQYKGLDPLIKQFAPKYPSGLSALRADYLIYNEDLANRLPQYSYLFDPSSDKVPDNFKLVYWSDAVVVYEITK